MHEPRLATLDSKAGRARKIGIAMSDATRDSIWSIGLKGRCPRCGEGKLFHQILNVREKCDKCGLSYGFADAGDGPSIFVMFLLGALMVGAALFVELTYSPPLWLHAVLWAPMTMILAIIMLRPMKGVLIALQYRNKAEQGALENDDAKKRAQDAENS